MVLGSSRSRSSRSSVASRSSTSPARSGGTPAARARRRAADLAVPGESPEHGQRPLHHVLGEARRGQGQPVRRGHRRRAPAFREVVEEGALVAEQRCQQGRVDPVRGVGQGPGVSAGDVVPGALHQRAPAGSELRLPAGRGRRGIAPPPPGRTPGRRGPSRCPPRPRPGAPRGRSRRDGAPSAGSPGAPRRWADSGCSGHRR